MSVPPLNPDRFHQFGALKDTDDRCSRKLQPYQAITDINDQQETGDVNNPLHVQMLLNRFMFNCFMFNRFMFKLLLPYSVTCLLQAKR